MFKFIIGIAILGGALWYYQYWPFDGSTALPKREPPAKT